MTTLFKLISLKNTLEIISFFTKYDDEGYLIEEKEENCNEEASDDIDDGFESENDDTIDANNPEE